MREGGVLPGGNIYSISPNIVVELCSPYHTTCYITIVKPCNNFFYLLTLGSWACNFNICISFISLARNHASLKTKKSRKKTFSKFSLKVSISKG